MSSMIKMHIPRGQRPRTENLEKQVDQVMKLGNLIDLMRKCWSNEKGQRPSFRNCREEMEVVFGCYKWKIMSAVSEVQDILFQKMQKENSSRTEAKVLPSLSSKGASLAPGRSEDYRAFSSTHGLEEQLRTFHLKETPSVLNEAVPPEVILKEKSLNRSKSMCSRNKSERPEQENPHVLEVQTSRRSTGGNKQRPRSDTFAYPLYPNNPAYQQYPPPFYALHQGDIGFPQQNPSFLGHSAPAVSYGGIQINAKSMIGVQIGPHNHMQDDYSET